MIASLAEVIARFDCNKYVCLYYIYEKSKYTDRGCFFFFFFFLYDYYLKWNDFVYDKECANNKYNKQKYTHKRAKIYLQKS